MCCDLDNMIFKFIWKCWKDVKVSLCFAFFLSIPFIASPFTLETFLGCPVDRRGSIWYETGTLNLNQGRLKRKINSKKLSPWPVISKRVARQLRGGGGLPHTLSAVLMMWHIVYEGHFPPQKAVSPYLPVPASSNPGGVKAEPAWVKCCDRHYGASTPTPKTQRHKEGKQGKSMQRNATQPTLTFATVCSRHPRQKTVNWWITASCFASGFW